ncbi:TolC family protein [Chamaesiphon sp. OTE_8_metabat_110]|uniref:TolC family protein n=1 Tax=Chamaesiphon sp. OTE_8_metabat_110 TaxID=2964696 RepID=UPI00286B7307|nr:TolC family protein [Chamaesiphon sp. OTE_8_metabat_110]
MLNRPIPGSNLKLSSHTQCQPIGISPAAPQTTTGWQLMCVTIALLSGALRMETARAATPIVASRQQRPQLAIDTSSRHDNSIQIAQNTTAPATFTNIQLPNDLNLPNTGSQVQITGRQSITLQQALDIAFRNNRQVQAARLTVERDRQGINLAQASQAVRVGLSNTGITTSGSPLLIGEQPQIPGSTSSSTGINGGITANYTILDAGRNQSSVRAAEEQVRFDRLDLVRVEQLVRGQVIAAYYDLQAADSAIKISQASVTDATRSLNDAQLQERAGVGTRFDILTAQVQLGTANQNLTNAQAQQQTARKNLAQILVVDQNTEFTAADPVRELGTWQYSLEDSIILAFKNRPEVEQQLSLRRISQQQEIIAAAADSAQVNLVGSYGLGKNITSSAGAQDNYSVGVQLSWNFFDGGAAAANTNREKVSQQIFENQFTTTRNQIRFQVEQAFFSLGSNQKNIATSAQALRQAEESLKLARLRFQAGVGTQTDVIVAQTNLATARGNNITAVLNYNRALANLRTATVLPQ